MWASDQARCRAILKLFDASQMGAKGLWTLQGPTAVALDYLENGSPLSHGEAILLQVAFDIWNGRGNAKVDDLLCTLDDTNLRAVCDALLARDDAARVMRRQAVADAVETPELMRVEEQLCSECKEPALCGIGAPPGVRWVCEAHFNKHLASIGKLVGVFKP